MNIPVFYYDTLESSQDKAKEILATKQPPAHFIVQCRVQTKGRGSKGRVWVSNPGNLYASFVLKRNFPLIQAAQISFIMGLAVHNTIAKLKHIDVVQLKWPNDVLLNEKKIAGILTETYEHKTNHTNWLLIGVGINIMHAPLGTIFPAGFLNEGVKEENILSVDWVSQTLQSMFIARLEEWRLQGFSYIKQEYQKFLWRKDQEILLNTGKKMIQGILLGIDDDGACLINTGTTLEKVYAGDVTYN